MCEIVKKKRLRSGIPRNRKFPFFLFKQNLLHKKFIFFPVSSPIGKKKIFGKRYWVTDLPIKINATDSKKWVKFVAMQQNSVFLNYDIKKKICI